MGQDGGAGKAALRRTALRARAGMSESARAAASQSVVATLEELGELAGRRTVAAYAATAKEVAIDPWIAARIAAGIGVFLPVVVGDGLALFRIAGLPDLTPGYRGVREPRPAGRRRARVDRIEAFVVPGAAFDPAGNRIGYGGGHFDRLLAGAAPGAALVGVAFEAQIVESVPTERHDVPVHTVVTESRVIRCRPVVADPGSP